MLFKTTKFAVTCLASFFFGGAVKGTRGILKQIPDFMSFYFFVHGIFLDILGSYIYSGYPQLTNWIKLFSHSKCYLSSIFFIVGLWMKIQTKSTPHIAFACFVFSVVIQSSSFSFTLSLFYSCCDLLKKSNQLSCRVTHICFSVESFSLFLQSSCCKTGK